MKKVLSALIVLGTVCGANLVWADALLINGAGATFPYPIYSKWFDEYHKMHPEIQFNYQSIGSGGGIRQISERTVDFGATDGPMTDAQLEGAKGAVLHFPTVLGGVVPIFNVPDVTAKLNFTRKAIAGIFLGDIKMWNDPEIANANPGVNLPSTAIVVVHRSDGSGTTYCWTDFLGKVSPDWSRKVGKGTSVNWPVGLGGKGNEGVAGLVKQTPGSIGYVELIYARQTNTAYGSLQNKRGKFIECSIETVTAAADSAGKKMPYDFRVSIADADGDKAYPASTFTWLLVYQSQSNKAKGKALVDFLRWMVTDGQKLASDLGYAPLPSTVASKVQSSIQKIKV